MTLPKSLPVLLAALMALLGMLSGTTHAAVPATQAKSTTVVQKTTPAKPVSVFEESKRYQLDNYWVVIPAIFSEPKVDIVVRPGEKPRKGVSSYTAVYEKDHFFSIKGPKNLTTDADIQSALLDIKQRFLSGDSKAVILSEKSGRTPGGYPFLEFVLQAGGKTGRNRVVAIPPSTLYQFIFYSPDASKVTSHWVNRYFDNISFTK